MDSKLLKRLVKMKLSGLEWTQADLAKSMGHTREHVNAVINGHCANGKIAEKIIRWLAIEELKNDRIAEAEQAIDGEFNTAESRRIDMINKWLGV